jgi:hypothetical protein
VKKLAIKALVLLMFGGYADSYAGDSGFDINGDFRYRHEWIEKEDTKSRLRHRLRARVNIEGKINDNGKIVVGISSGSDDPVSNNQSLGSGWSSKDVVLDLAYFEYTCTRLPGLSLIGGKMDNPFYKPGKSELVWDSDIRQEGLVAHYDRDFNNVSIHLTGAGLWLEERKLDEDSYLLSGQGVMNVDLPESKAGFTVGGSYYGYKNSLGHLPYFDPEDPYGNSRSQFVSNPGDTIDGYKWDFEMIELFAEVNVKLGYIPVTVMGDYVNNTAADSLNDGWLVGIRAGKTKKPGSWDVRYIYREVKKDAVVGIFTDSDFIGGGTDGKGHEFGGSYQLADKTTLAITYFINDIGIDNGKTFKRLQVDAKFKF